MPECVSNTCCAADAVYNADGLAEWSQTDLPMPWAYYLMDEGDETPTRVDSTGQGHDLTSDDLTYPDRIEGRITPWSNELDGSHTFQTPVATMDTLADSWAFHCWLRLGVPAIDSTIFIYGEGTPNQIELRQFWDGSNLTFRLQSGYYAPPFDAIAYYNHVVLTNQSSPFNAWYFVTGSYGGGRLILALNDIVNDIPALDLDATVPPIHAELDETFHIGENFVGRIGPLGIWTPDNYLTIANVAKLWRSGLGLALKF